MNNSIEHLIRTTEFHKPKYVGQKLTELGPDGEMCHCTIGELYAQLHPDPKFAGYKSLEAYPYVRDLVLTRTGDPTFSIDAIWLTNDDLPYNEDRVEFCCQIAEGLGLTVVE